VIVPGAGIVKSDIEISLIGETKKVKKALLKLQKAIEDTNGTYNVANDMREGEKETKFSINPYGESLGFTEKKVSGKYLKTTLLKDGSIKYVSKRKAYKDKD